jgi:hypothetical protein
MDNQSAIVKKWSRYYRQIQSLSRKLTAPPYSGERVPYGERQDVERRIKEILQDCRDFLDSMNIKAPKPLWRYDAANEQTWASSPQFKYSHLHKADNDERATKAA